ncbi:MAG: hypothetical protein GEV03_21690 [Streptosporangiales bacterium]|nr:hypothetical protein [Streptosporangiales bacterium]
MADGFRADCENLIDFSGTYLRPLASDVSESAQAVSDLRTCPETWGTGPSIYPFLGASYEAVRQFFEDAQWDVAVTLSDVADALCAVAENYLRLDRQIS